MRSVDRFVVFNVGATRASKRGYGNTEACKRRTFTSYGDAANAALYCSKQTKQAGVASVESKPCLLLHGMPGSEKIVGRCFKGKCGKPVEGAAGDAWLLKSCKLDKAAKKAARRTAIKETVEARSRRTIVTERARGLGRARKSRK